MIPNRPEFYGLPQDPIEVVNYFLDLRQNLRKRFCSFMDIGSIEEQYLDAAINLHVHLAGALPLCLSYKNRWAGHSESVDLNEFPVFIYIGESLKEKERTEPNSLVRLEPLDHCEMFIREMFESAAPVSSELLRRVADRKLCAILLAAGVAPRQDEDDIIKCSTGVEGELAKQAHRGIARFISEHKIGITAIRLNVIGNRLQCILPSALQEYLELRNLFPCPIYPELTLMKRAHMEMFHEG
jgi:hypothetical protein